MSPTSSTMTSASEESRVMGYLLPLSVRSGGQAETTAVVIAPSHPLLGVKKNQWMSFNHLGSQCIPIAGPSHRALHVSSFWDLIAAGGIWVILQEGPLVSSVVAGMSDLSGTSCALLSDRCLAVAPWLRWCSAAAPTAASSPSTWLLASLSPSPFWWLAKCLVRPQPQPQLSAITSLSNKCLAREQRGRGHPQVHVLAAPQLWVLWRQGWKRLDRTFDSHLGIKDQSVTQSNCHPGQENLPTPQKRRAHGSPSLPKVTGCS